jgi:hypothetical protein
MNLPSGLVFYLDFQYGNSKTPFTAGGSLYGDAGTNPSTAPFGNTNTGGLYGAGRFGYSINLTQSVVLVADISTGSATLTDICWDSQYSASVADGSLVLATINTSSIDANFDPEALRSFYLTGSNAPEFNAQYPQFTQFNADQSAINFVVAQNSIDPADDPTNLVVSYSLAPTDNERGDFEEGNNNLNGNNSPISIPEINVQM